MHAGARPALSRPESCLAHPLGRPTVSVSLRLVRVILCSCSHKEVLMTAIDDALESNASYAAGFDKGDLPLPPARNLAVVACMDARLDTHKILGLEEGDAHVIRNAGGVVSDDAIRSLVISQRLLGTREILLIHHTDCGMLTFRDDDVKDAIEGDTGLRPTFALEAFGDLEQDVRQSIARIQASPFIPHKDQVRGFVYDCASGRLNEVSPA